MLLVGGNPLVVYKQLADGAGLPGSLQWIPGNPFGVTVREASIAETNLISTIVSATPAMLAGCRSASPSAAACSTSAPAASS